MERPSKESIVIEFKSDRKCYSLAKLYEDLVGMANTDGGWLFLGMEDNGTPTGVDRQHRDGQYMEAVIAMNRRMRDHEVDWEQRRYELAKEIMRLLGKIQLMCSEFHFLAILFVFFQL